MSRNKTSSLKKKEEKKDKMGRERVMETKKTQKTQVKMKL